MTDTYSLALFPTVPGRLRELWWEELIESLSLSLSSPPLDDAPLL